MTKKKPHAMTPRQAGRKSIEARIARRGINGHLQIQAKAARARTHKLTPEHRRKISVNSVESRERQRKMIEVMSDRELHDYLIQFPKRIRFLDSDRLITLFRSSSRLRFIQDAAIRYYSRLRSKN